MLALAAPLLLTGCLWSPGKFNSTLMLQKSGRFVLDYKGEIILQVPDDMDVKSRPWNPKMARCSKNADPKLLEVWQVEMEGAEALAGPPGAGETAEQKAAVRPCTATETATLKAQYEKKEAQRVAAERKQKAQAAAFFGVPGADDAASRGFAEKLKIYAGWREVTYRGNGVFDVDYHLEGHLTHDVTFPSMPDSQFVMPFITIRRRADRAAIVQAPALGGSSNPILSGAMMGEMGGSTEKPFARAHGRFTVVTGGEILTNNSEEGPQPHASGRQVHWDVTPSATAKVPEMLVRL